MEDQLQRLIKAVTDSSAVVTKAICESNHEEFSVVRDRLDSIFGIIFRQTSVQPIMQDISSISTEPRARNMQVPPTAIDARNEEVHQLLRPIQSVAVDLNKLSNMVLLELQHVAALELEK